jgi:two-component system, NarL family, response regulator DevR
MIETKPISILLVEDHEVTRAGLRSLLNAFDHLRVVGEAETVAEAVNQAVKLSPDVILLDIRLRDGSGFEVCRRLQDLNVESRVLYLTSFADDEILFEAIASGADGYLLKEINSRALVNAIESVVAGNSILDPAVTRRVLARVQGVVAPSGADDGLSRLSPQEFRIVSFVAEGKTNKEIAAAMGLSEKTVKNYLSNAMGKLKTRRRSQAAALFTRRSKHSLG